MDVFFDKSVCEAAHGAGNCEGSDAGGWRARAPAGEAETGTYTTLADDATQDQKDAALRLCNEGHDNTCRIEGNRVVYSAAGPTEYPGTDEGYTQCRQANADCYKGSDGKWHPTRPAGEQDTPGDRPGEDDGFPPCPEGQECHYYIDDQGRTHSASACPQGQRCFGDGDAYTWEDEDGDTHYTAVQPGPCMDVPPGMECFGTNDGQGHYFCPEDDSECMGAIPAPGGDIADNLNYLAVGDEDECAGYGGTMVEGTSVCQIIGECPSTGLLGLGHSCSRSVTKEQSYADFEKAVLNEARLKSLMEGGPAGKAWGKIFSLITFGKIPADIPLWEEFWQTDAGLFVTGDWETSICRDTSDVEDTVGMIMNPSATGIGMWVKAEVTGVTDRPNETSPAEQAPVFIYKITLSVLPAGLTPHSGEEDCQDRIAFLVKLTGDGEQQIDFRQPNDPSDDLVELQCDGQPATYTGASAIVMASARQYDRVCLEFRDSDLVSYVSGALDDGKLCATIARGG